MLVQHERRVNAGLQSHSSLGRRIDFPRNMQTHLCLDTEAIGSPMLKSGDLMHLKILVLLLLILSTRFVTAQVNGKRLSGNTVLIIRHAEKPAKGAALNHQGEIRARMYAQYFEPFREAGMSFPVDMLFAGADSKNSQRPRLTLEPLSSATHLPLDLCIGTKEPEKLVSILRMQQHGQHPLIAWRRGQIPQLLQAFGADLQKLLPGGKWPDDVFDWVIILKFNDAGKLTGEQRVSESLQVPQD